MHKTRVVHKNLAPDPRQNRTSDRGPRCPLYGRNVRTLLVTVGKRFGSPVRFVRTLLVTVRKRFGALVRFVRTPERVDSG